MKSQQLEAVMNQIKKTGQSCILSIRVNDQCDKCQRGGFPISSIQMCFSQIKVQIQKQAGSDKMFCIMQKR